ncbi:hypothetical protein GCM10012290_11520 [Halolactibacillus alkaliphilus]|uniref:Sporulation protein YqfC n=1 Tax=Halolactibacillus alkaliphilus TaxID=442899 RepID=A0A511X394_9BACI|nr:YabP/YqfC family sporulation protein [Halolactibacillus alkaliphilus]GEN57416.1 hypothetical protein HAL01_18800 [Halolactibacillus alkaliphilus]GGN69137.1 hypothetical protein GCM10012290_11520 [Halolactibacillus alkaliphilus]SFO73840.1 sporulation protein YqfC [Halolactibacillus alkaliphilus]
MTRLFTSIKEFNHLSHLPKITLIGDQTLIVQVFKKLLILTDRHIEIQLESHILIITGQSLIVDQFTLDFLVIQGLFTGLEFKEGCSDGPTKRD